jgi:hypothetical protein
MQRAGKIKIPTKSNFSVGAWKDSEEGKLVLLDKSYIGLRSNRSYLVPKRFSPRIEERKVGLIVKKAH